MKTLGTTKRETGEAEISHRIMTVHPAEHPHQPGIGKRKRTNR